MLEAIAPMAVSYGFLSHAANASVPHVPQKNRTELYCTFKAHRVEAGEHLGGG